MSLLDRLSGRRTGVRGPGFAAAETSRLTASLAREAEYINRTLRYQLRALRARSRQAAQNNPFARRFVQLAVDNIGGPKPFRLQSKVRYNSGKFDTAANQKIEAAWSSWGRAGNCEVTGKWSWNTLQRLMLSVLPTDGELLFRKLRGPQFGKHWFQLQMIDVDRLDETKNERLQNGGAIHMGVEIDSYSRPVAYHLLKRKPAMWDFGYVREYERVPAEDIVHIFVPTFAEQVRGVPWMYAALLNLVHIGAFEEAAIIAARVGASQMGVIESPDGGQTLAEGQPKAASGDPQIEAEPGSFPLLPPGYKLSSWNPQFPDAAVEPFVKAMLRGVGAGLGVAYHNIANDPSDVNYSTAKVFGGDEHEMWKGLQVFFAEHANEPIFPDWMKQQLLANILPFPFDRMDKYIAPVFIARRWTSPDPLKDSKADQIRIQEKLRSRTQIIADGGDDIEEVWDEIAHETEMAKDKRINLTPQPAAPAAPQGDPEDEPEDPDSGNAQT